jgi:hypothetical protein
MSVEPSPVQDAPTPFSGAPDPEDTNPPSDFILRSSDNVDFHVHKQILAFVSVFFANMFKFPIGNNAPTETERDGKTVLPIPETKDVLYRLLCIAYPARSRQHYSLSPADLDSISAVHEAAHKYQFVQAQAVITEMLMDPVLLDGQPHRLFAIAVLRNIPELARQAALSTLEQPMCPEALAFPEMAQITWETAQKLYEFHHRCGRVAQEIVHMTTSSVDRDEIGPHANPVFATSDYTASHEAFTWWQEKYHHAEECRAKYDAVEQHPSELLGYYVRSR